MPWALQQAVVTGASDVMLGLEECIKHTDLEWRLAQIPDSAACRGAFLNMLDDRAREASPEVHAAYREFFGTYHFSPLRLYPVKDYVIRIAKLAEIQFGGPRIYEGIRAIQASAFPAWRETLVGRTTFAMLGSNFHLLFLMSHKAMAKGLNYVDFEVKNDRPGHYLARFVNQYLYIEHAMLGGIEGLARSCNQPAEVKAHLESAFTGVVEVTLLRRDEGARP